MNTLRKGMLAGALALGAAAAQAGVQVGDMDLHAFGWSPPVYSYYEIDPSGDIFTNSSTWGDTYGVDAGDWLSPKSGMGGYEVRFSNQWGSCQGSFGTWISMASGAPLAYTTAAVDNTNTFCTFTVEIRAAANPSVILGSASISLNANTGI